MGRVRIKRTLIHGFGINDADYPVHTNDTPRVICKFYLTWTSMIRRCYSSYALRRNPTYVGCSVCEEWKYFSNFKAWMETQDWEGKELDKDLLVPGNKIYSPSTCCFIRGDVNKFMTDAAKCRGELPIGVTKAGTKKEGYKAQCHNPFLNTVDYLGTFPTPEEAHNAWMFQKTKHAEQLAAREKDERISKAILDRYKRINKEFV